MMNVNGCEDSGLLYRKDYKVGESGKKIIGINNALILNGIC